MSSDPSTPPTSVTDGTPCVAIPELLGRCMNSADVAEMLLRKLDEQLRRELPEIQRCLSAGDSGATARIAHSIKGAAATIGAHGIAGFAAETESLARAADITAAERTITGLTAEAERYRAQLPRLTQSLRAQGL